MVASCRQQFGVRQSEIWGLHQCSRRYVHPDAGCNDVGNVELASNKVKTIIGTRVRIGANAVNVEVAFNDMQTAGLEIEKGRRDKIVFDQDTSCEFKALAV